MKVLKIFALVFLSFVIFSNCSKDEENSKTINDGLTNEIVKDIDGNSYRVVKIGDQFWLADNFKSTRFTDGDVIADAKPYDNNPVYLNSYGLLYNWEDFNNPKLAPEGWRIPTIEDYKILVNTVGYRDSTYNGKFCISFSPTDISNVLWDKVTDYNYLNIKMAGTYGTIRSIPQFYDLTYSASYFCIGNGESCIRFSRGRIYYSINAAGTRDRTYVRLIKK